jgi:plasmid replication initiation protein
MTLQEKRVLLLGISKVNPEVFPRQGEPFSFVITVKDWKKHFPDDPAPWQSLRRAAKRLLTRYVTLHPKTGETEHLSWFDSVSYKAGSAQLTMRFSWSIQVRLAGMLEQFTQIDMLGIQRLTSTHSVRLYELLSQFKSTGCRVISIEDFRYAMDCADKYPQNKHLTQFVINPALADLNKNSDLTATVETVKQGRAITHLKFNFRKNPQQRLTV